MPRKQASSFHTRRAPNLKVGMRGAPLWKVAGERPPLATCTQSGEISPVLACRLRGDEELWARWILQGRLFVKGCKVSYYDYQIKMSRYRQLIAKIKAGNRDLKIIDLESLFCNKTECRNYSDGQFFTGMTTLSPLLAAYIWRR
jgi:hypothetical protein